MAELAQALETPVLLVVGLKLGCLNHARLTLEAIARSGLRIRGLDRQPHRSWLCGS